MQVRKQFPFTEFEPKWQAYWEHHASFRAANPGEPGCERPKFYILDMFPYPSGAGLHVGHPEGYTATDIIARYKRARGFNVLHPMGWDAFGLPAEQHAVKTGTHPRITNERNIATFKRQIKALGFSYDWSREVNTTDPAYYKWTQWIFAQLYKQGLAYVSEAPVWYCPELGTVLANEEVLATDSGPRSERGNHPVERRPLRQWMLKITAYAERLLNDLDGLDWPESLKEMQRNWIGRSEGASVKFKLESRAETRRRGEELELDSNKLCGSAALREDYIEVFTTRPDTLFGATYLVLAPEHPLVNQITADSERASVSAYIKEISAKSDLERTDLAKTKTGCFTGAFAVNPVNGARIPVWIADYVLMSYGTGAIMAVPAHDERDFEFAQKFSLPVIEVVRPADHEPRAETQRRGEELNSNKLCGSAALREICFSGEGIVINSGFLNGLPTSAAKQTITAWLVERGLGEARVQYKLRDWLFSRQRYWGEPFPVAWKDGNHFLLPDDALPVTLPELADYQPSKEGLAPLSKAKDWLALPDGAQRETNTMPQWGGSCWYYLRYCDPTNHTLPIGADADRYWLQPHGVDLYVGGAEHAVLHLLYARFWHKVLFDLGIVSTSEPFHKLVNQGLILGEDGQKMSKSLGNVVNPDDVVAAYGADALRLFEMFMGPLEQVKPWSTQGVEGVYRFLGRVWRLVMTENQAGDWLPNGTVSDTVPAPALLKSLHQCIKKVTADIEAMSFNTAIAALMVLTNDLTKSATHPRAIMEPFLQLLAPFAPHLAEELWQTLGHPDSLTRAPWPQFDEKYLIEDTLDLIIQVNGKLRAKLTISASLNVSDYEATVKQHADYEKWLGGKALKKCVTVPGKLVNLVVG